MRFHLLGTLAIMADDGSPLAVDAPKRRALLAVLLIDADRPVSTERLIDALWGAESPPAALESLQAHISRLRRDIGSHRILSVPSGYVMPMADGELDTQVFEQRVAEGRRLSDARQWGEAANVLRAGLALWRGAALAEFAYQEFAQVEIRRLEELRLVALETRLEADLALGRHAELAGELDGIVSSHPLRERLRHFQMLALYRSGRQADALAAYRQFRSTMVDELGIDPTPDLQELEVRILRQDPSLAVPGGEPRQAPIRLPAALTSFVGRTLELAEAVDILRTHRLLTLTGPGGVGKSRLSVVVGEALIEAFPDGVVFVDLSEVRDPGYVSSRIAEAIGGGERPAEIIGGRRMLLILDNFEQVLDAAVDVAHLLAACARLTVLVTSRAPLHVRGERQLDVPPLSAAEGATLFVDRARAVALRQSHHAGTVADIVATLDGLPLAIELAAARIRVLSTAALRERLTSDLSLLADGPRDAPPRHRALDQTISWSYGLLSDSGQAAFRQLSVLAAGYDLAAARAITGVDLDGMLELVDHSLVRCVDDRYSMLETIRTFATSQAAAMGEVNAARDRHLEHYLSVASSTSRGTTDVDPHGRNLWHAMCASERDNLRNAFDWAVREGKDDAVVRLFRSIGMYWLMVGAVDEGIRWGEAAVEAARRLGSDRRLMTALLTLSEFPRFSGDHPRALDLKLQAIDLAQTLGERGSLDSALDDVAHIYAVQGDFERARSILHEVLARHDREPADDPEDRAHTVVTLAEVSLMEGQLQTARRYLDELSTLEASMDLTPDWVLESDVLRAAILRAAGADGDAESMLQGVVRDAAEMEFRMSLLEGLSGLAAIHASRRPVHAARLLGMAERLRAESRFAFNDPKERERTITLVRNKLGDPEFQRLHSEGHALTIAAMRDVALGGDDGVVTQVQAGRSRSPGPT